MKKLLAMLTATLLLPACAMMNEPVDPTNDLNTAMKVWYKPGWTPEGFTTDFNQCEYDTQKAAGSYHPSGFGTLGTAMAQNDRQHDLMEMCLKARGYTRLM